MAEERFPLVFETHEYRPGSAGDGRHRGGYGGDMRLRVETDGAALANTAGEGIVHGARGVLGGHDGAPHDYTLLPPGAPPRKLKSKEVGVVVPPGSVHPRVVRRRWRLGTAGRARPGGAGEGCGGGADELS